MHRTAFLLFVICCLLLSAGPLALATDYSSTNFKVSNPVIEELGGYSTSTSFRLLGSIPFIEPLRGTSTSYINIPGFPAFIDPSTPTPSSTGGGGAAIDLNPPPSPPTPPKPKPTPTEEIFKRVDFNHDGFVNFVDFSILLYYFDKTGSIITPFDLNSDAAVDMVDISIFMYYWDGK